jgi:hypothetical protein
LKEYVSLSHIGIHGNTTADSAAKHALQLPITDYKNSHTLTSKLQLENM